MNAAPAKGHRPTAGLLRFGPRVTVRVSPTIQRTTTQMLCDKCGQPVVFRHGRWVHGSEVSA